MAKYIQLGITKNIHNKKSRRKGLIKTIVEKMRYVNRDSVARPARRFQLKCPFELKNWYLSHSNTNKL